MGIPPGGEMLSETLSRKRNSIIGKWLELVAQTHPAGMNLLRETDRFTNPVRYIFAEALEALYDEVIEGKVNSEKTTKALDEMLRVRAVQDFSPGQAVGFVFLLKQALRESLGSDIKDHHLSEDLIELDKRIDGLALAAFDTYMKCREEIFEIRVGEIKAARDDAFRLLDRMSRRAVWLAGEEDKG